MFTRYILLPVLFIFSWQTHFGQNAEKSIFDPSIIHQIQLSFDIPSWEDSLFKYKNNGLNNRLTAHVKIDMRTYEQVQVRFKGNSSYHNFAKNDISKLPFNLKIKKSIAADGFQDTIHTVKLSNIFRDRSYIREFLTYQIMGRYLPLPKIAFAEVYVGDTYLGLYEIIEGLDTPFLKRTFQNKNGVFIKGDPLWNKNQISGCPTSENSSLQYLGKHPDCYKKWYELKSKLGWGELVKLCAVLHNRPNEIESKLDVHTTLWMLALNNVMVSLDSYSGALCHNYYLYKPKGGVFTTIPWDFNLSFGAFKATGLGDKLRKKEMQELSPYVHFKEENKKRPLITKLLAQPIYRKLYINMIKTILDDFFRNDKYLQIGAQTQSFITNSVKKEQGRIYSFADFGTNMKKSVRTNKDSLIGIQELMKGRTIYFDQHPSLKHEPPKANIEDIAFSSDQKNVSIQVQNAHAVTFYYRIHNGAQFYSSSMHLNNGSDIWQLEVPSGKIEAYYFVLENKSAASLLPKRAPWHPILN